MVVRKLGQLGEKNLLRTLRSFFGTSPRIVRAFSEDCTVLNLSGRNDYLLATTDVLVDGVHFTTDYASHYRIGKKALLANISDISAMGGLPLFYLVSLGAPAGMRVRDLRRLYQGMRSGGGTTRAELIGGNVSTSPVLFLDIMMLGKVERKSLLLRNGARPGDRIFLSGPLGAASAGLVLFRKGFRLRGKVVISPAGKKAERFDRRLMQAHLEPPCRSVLARVLAACGMVSSMIDLSDGLVSDLLETCRESRCGALIHLPAVPLARGIRIVARRWQQDPLGFALYGGEDYELLFTVAHKDYRKFLKFAERKNLRLYEIGEIVKGRPVVQGHDQQGKRHYLQGGFEHWSKP